MAKPKIRVDKGVEIPRHRARNVKYPWHDMKIGDSFPVPNDKRDTIASAAIDFGKRHGRKFTIRTTPEGVRVWRTE